MKLNMKTIGQNIAHSRRQINLTQQQLADAIGVARPRVAEWETGVMTDMMLSSFLPMAALFADDTDQFNQLLDGAIEPEAIYVVRDDAGGDEWMTFHKTLEAANDDAVTQWRRLTKKEQAGRHIFVMVGIDTDPFDLEGTGYDVPDGAFDSDNI